MSEPFIGEIRLFAGNFAPRGWAFCDGRRVPIAQNVALFSLLGTMFGGDGQVDFALPNLGGRFPIGAGAGPGLAERVQGEMGGQETVTLLQANLPPHNHTLPATTADATENAPGPGRHPARTREETFAEGAPVATAVTTTPAGAGEPVANMPPALVVSFIIALQGIYPSRG